MKMTTLYGIFLIVVIVVGGVGFYAGTAFAPEKIVEKEVKPPRTIKLGTTMSVTGKYSPSVERWTALTKEFVKMVNERGGIYVAEYKTRLPIEIVVYDDKSVPETSAEMIERLITVDKVDFLVGPDWSPIGFAASVPAEKNKVPIVMANVLSLDIYKRGYKWIFGTPIPCAERWEEYYFPMIMAQTPKPKTIAFMTEDLLYCQDVRKFSKLFAEQYGLTIVADEVFPSGIKDATAMLVKIKPLNPDIVHICAYEEATIVIARQMKELDINPKDFHSIMGTGKAYEGLGKLGEYLGGTTQWIPGSPQLVPYIDYAELLKRADCDVFKYTWTTSRMSSYLIMLQAIENAGTLDRAKVRDVLATMTFNTPIGHVKFKDDGLARNPAFPGQWIKGKFVVVGPEAAATGKLVYPRPTWAQIEKG